MEKENIMQYESVLPEDFYRDGTWYFTNFSDEDFIGKWGGKSYVYPAGTTSKMVIPEHSPLEIQNIRKKFAKDLAEREYFKTQNYNRLHAQERNADGTPRLNSIHMAGTYSLEDLTPLIRKCLVALPAGQVTVTESPRENLEEKLSRNNKGELNTTIIDDSVSLKDLALGGSAMPQV